MVRYQVRTDDHGRVFLWKKVAWRIYRPLGEINVDVTNREAMRAIRSMRDVLNENTKVF